MTQASTQGAGLLFSLAGVWLRLPQISELQMRQRRGGVVLQHQEARLQRTLTSLVILTFQKKPQTMRLHEELLLHFYRHSGG